ncbi:MAG TPA: hypothetical protein VFY92_02340 [Hyphomicrobiaceae bacterium]|nr:hypothetical protein [Hyphomicrobiaceae bacterium]
MALSALGLGSMSPAALAFEETTVGAGDAKAPAAPVLEIPKELPKDTGAAVKGLNGQTKGLELQIAPGTEVRIPGLGTVGVLPKLDFGLELLYGANEQKGPYQDKTEPDDVQLRGTIKHRF